MKNKFLYLLFSFILVLSTSCQKDLRGSLISINASTNDNTLNGMRVYLKCSALADPSIGSPIAFTPDGDGAYFLNLDEKESSSSCLMVVGTIPENQSSEGVTKVTINAFFTEHGNIVGFQDIEIKRPHGQRQIKYEFHTDTYLEN